jgi:hypothetical protein
MLPVILQVADDGELLRFLRSKNFDKDAAAKAYVKHQKWRTEFVPNGHFTEAELPEELSAKKIFWISQDKKGRPAILVRGKDHVYNKKDFDQFKRMLSRNFLVISF